MAATPDIGYIYCITNPSMPGVVKIGMTRRTPEDRLADANRDTWNHTKFQLAFAKKVQDPEQKERAIHKILEQHGQRKSASREFFTISVELTKMYFDLIEGDFLESTSRFPKGESLGRVGADPPQSAQKSSEKGVIQVQPSSIPKKKERKPRKKDTVAQVAHVAQVSHVAQVAHVAPIAQVAQVAHVAQVSHVAEVAEVSHVAQMQEPGREAPIDLFTLLSQSAHDIDGWPPVQHLNSYESYLLLSTAFDKKLLRLLIRGTPYQFDELNQIDATAIRGSPFELIDNKGYLVTSSRVDELFERMQKREYATLCTGTGRWRTVGDLGDAPHA